MTPNHEARRRIATYVMSDMVCMHWPAQFWLRHEGRIHDALLSAYLAARKDEIVLREELFELLSQSDARMASLIDLIDDQIGLPP